MSAAAQLSGAATSARLAGDTLQRSLGSSSAEDLHAGWESAFERARELDPVLAAAIQIPLVDCIAPDEPDVCRWGAEATWKISATTQPASAESVCVFVHGAAVAVVLRDAAISTEAALLCAFETARELTGQRAALQQLTLNGRSIYQQHDDSPVRDRVHGCEQPEPMLVFAC